MAADVILFTDASLRGRRASWGAVALKQRETPFEAFGISSVDTGNSVLAELYAIANGLHAVVDSGYAELGCRITIRSDSSTCCQLLRGIRLRREKARATFDPLVTAIADHARQHRITLMVKWIPGHLPEAAHKHAVHNRRADALARKAHRQEAIEE